LYVECVGNHCHEEGVMTGFGNSNPGSGYGGPRYPGTFLLALREAIVRLNWTPAVWKPGSVECLDSAGKSQHIGMDNMYRRLKQEPRDKWADLLVEVLASVPPEAATPPQDLNEVADRLLVRLGPPFAHRSGEPEIWSRPLIANCLAALLVIDYPNSMSYVSQKLIADSGKDPEIWFAQALENLSARTTPDCVKVVHEESGLLQSQVGDAYDSSRALLLDALRPGHEDNGFFVVVPGRDHLLFLPIVAETMVIAPWLRAIAGKTFRDMPYPISPELFWVRQGVWHLFEIATEGEDILVKPPPEFTEVLARLQPDVIEGPPQDDSDDLSV
jgi:hypothetical protein